MILLAVETSTLFGSAALLRDGQVIAERSSRKQKSHSEVLNGFVTELLTETGLQLSDIDAFAVGKGPGSFTGLRIAGNVAKTFAYSFSKPLIAIDSLTLLAEACPRDLPIFAMINAYKNMVYFGRFEVGSGYPRLVQGPDVIPVQSLGQVLKVRSLIVGDGFSTYEKHFDPDVRALMVRDEKVKDEPHASSLGRLAFEDYQSGLTLDWKSFVPLYIRASEAEETRRGLFIPSLTKEK